MQIKDLIPWSKRGGGLARHDRHSPVLALQRDINRMFDEFWRQFDRPNGWLEPAWGINGLRADVAETDESVEVTVELPGLDEKDIDVEVTDETLTIRGEKKTEREDKNKDYYLSERSQGSFYRSIPLPPSVDTGKATARYRQGVLTVIVPKTPEAKARVKKIPVNKAA